MLAVVNEKIAMFILQAWLGPRNCTLLAQNWLVCLLSRPCWKCSASLYSIHQSLQTIWIGSGFANRRSFWCKMHMWMNDLKVKQICILTGYVNCILLSCPVQKLTQFPNWCCFYWPPLSLSSASCIMFLSLFVYLSNNFIFLFLSSFFPLSYHLFLKNPEPWNLSFLQPSSNSWARSS